ARSSRDGGNVSVPSGFPPTREQAQIVTLKRVRRESIAGGDIALLQSPHEPALALFRRSMGETVGHDIALCFSLQAVVADGGRSLQRLIDVALIAEIVLS